MENDDFTRFREMAVRLMTPQENLDVRLFDYGDMMKADVREQLLARADRVIQKVFAPIEGLEVTDICLTGSAAGYFYREKSDIDLRIEIQNRKCPFISKNSDLLDSFLNSMSNGFHRIGNKAYLGQRSVDIKTSSRQIDFIGLYSILKNKWRIYPDRDVFRKISPDEVAKACLESKAKIEKETAALVQNERGMALADKLEKAYIRYLLNPPHPKDYLVTKILIREGTIRRLGAESVQTAARALSLKDLETPCLTEVR